MNSVGGVPTALDAHNCALVAHDDGLEFLLAQKDKLSTAEIYLAAVLVIWNNEPERAQQIVDDFINMQQEV